MLVEAAKATVVTSASQQWAPQANGHRRSLKQVSCQHCGAKNLHFFVDEGCRARAGVDDALLSCLDIVSGQQRQAHVIPHPSLWRRREGCPAGLGIQLHFYINHFIKKYSTQVPS